MRPNSVQFNMSHSDILALYAFTLDSEVGVDLEKIQAVPDAEQIAKHYFSSEECADFVSVAEEQRLEAFLRCWTRKEAYLKAVGHGLSVPLKSFRVSLRAEATPELLSVNGYSKPARKWILCDLPLSSDHIGTLAMSAPDRFILMREFGSPGEALDALKLCSRTL
jgi:4'-phosphopantetheinyl transferase